MTPGPAQEVEHGCSRAPEEATPLAMRYSGRGGQVVVDSRGLADGSAVSAALEVTNGRPVR